MNIRHLLLMLLSLFVLTCEPKPLDDGNDKGKEGEEQVDPRPEPEPEPEPEVKHVDPVPLSFVEKGKNMIDLSYDDTAGEWTLVTTGTDPYIYLAALDADLQDEHRVLSFDYLCSAGVDDIQIFYGKAIAESRSRHFGRIAAAGGENWKACAFSIAADRISFDWGKAGDNLRMDFGTKSNVRIRIKNLQMREMNDAELETYHSELAKAQGKDAEAARIGDYLSKHFPCSVSKVSVGASEITVSGRTDGGERYYLADIAPWENLTEMKIFSHKTVLSGSSFSVTLKRIVSRDGLNAYDRLLSRFAVVKEDGTLCSHARYADEIQAQSSPEAVKPATKKGLGGFVYNQNLSDLDELGIKSVTVNIVLNSVVNTVKKGNYTIEYPFCGTTYYMDKGYAAQLDKVMLECSKRGIVVSAILLNRQSDTNSSATPVMKHPENDGGNYSMPNLTTAQSVNVYAAALDFLAKRYSSSTYGRIHHWIMHNEVDFQKEWTNMGDQPEWRFMDAYVKSMRICHNIAHKYDPNASVLISLTHSWAKKEGQYASKSLLEDLCKYSSAEGDFLWGVAYHPYPQSLARPEFWKDDTAATYSVNSAYCTFKNLEVISAWMMDKAHFYMGSVKRILFLSENGTNSPSYSSDDLARQAAGAAWAWKKVDALEGIDGIQWHNWQDNRAEGGLRIGLRRFKDDSEDPNGRKPAWFVWQAAGTSKESGVFDQYLSVIGISSWDEIFQSVQ